MSGELLIVGKIAGLFGVKGWVKLLSYTEPRSGLFDYQPLYLSSADGWRSVQFEQGQEHGKGQIAKLAGIDDRDAALELVGAQLAIDREQLPPPAAGEYYWADLENLRVATLDGVDLGRVDHLFSTGANDVLVVRGDKERLIPFIRGEVIHDIDLDAGLIRVDWDPDF